MSKKATNILIQEDQLKMLEMLAMHFNIRSEHGVTAGNPSWRTMLSVMADNAPHFFLNPGSSPAVLFQQESMKKRIATRYTTMVSDEMQKIRDELEEKTNRGK